MKSFLLIIILLYCSLNATAQFDNVWAFGFNAGIDFNSTPPTSIKTNIDTREGSASICDVKGQLLFYTDGYTIWDRNHKPMPNGKDLPGVLTNITTSTSQAALIVPMPGKENCYYVFSLGYLGSGFGGLLYYCIVDMKMNRGMGDVVPAVKSKLLTYGLTEQMTAIPNDQCGNWLVVSSTSQIKSYRISSDGIDTFAVVSPKVSGGGYYGGMIGNVDFSPDLKKMASAQGNLVLYDFDVTTGKASRGLILDNGDLPNNFYGVSFSPDNSKLYTTLEPTLGLFQYDLSLADTLSIIKSKVELNGTGTAPAAIRRAADGKMYATFGSSLSVIHHPNLPGKACGYVKAEFKLNEGFSFLGLPNPSTIFENNKIYSAVTDTAFCADSFLLIAQNIDGNHYKWEDGAEGSRRWVYQSGIYTLNYHVWNGSKCEEHVDVFNIIVYNIPKHYTTTIFNGHCQADTFTMVANNLDQNHYLWEDSITTGKTRKVNRTGIYWVSYRSDSVCAHYVDSFIVNYPEKDPEVSFQADTLLCEKDLLQLENTSDPVFNSFTWRLGNQDSSLLKSPEYIYTQAGTYTITLEGKIDGICKDTVSKTIVVDARLPVHFQKTPDSICTGLLFTFYQAMKDNTLDHLKWSFGDGTELFSSDNEIQHAYTQAGSMSVSLDATFRACPSSTYTDTVSVYALPGIDLGPDQALCPEVSPLYLKNLLPESQALVHYLWNTGDTTAGIRVKEPGTYSLRVRSGPLGCSNKESVTIHKDCYLDIPNAFTPDGDGINDYFFPRQWSSKSVSWFKLQVFNRWGQTLFESNNPEGRGWDGRYKGKEEPAGVYVYLIEVLLANGRQENYQGNVTLIR